MVKKREFCALFLHVMTKEIMDMLIHLQVHSLPSIELLSQFTQGAAFLWENVMRMDALEVLLGYLKVSRIGEKRKFIEEVLQDFPDSIFHK